MHKCRQRSCARFNVFRARLRSQATRESVGTTLSTLILSYTITQASTSPKIEAVTVYANEFVLGVDGTRTELCPRQGREKHFFHGGGPCTCPSRGAGDHRVGGGAGPPTNFLVNLETAFTAPRPGLLRLLLRLANHAPPPKLGRWSWPSAASPEAAPGMDVIPKRKRIEKMSVYKSRPQVPHKMRTPRREDVASPPGRRLPISHKMRKHRQKMWSPHRGLGAGTPHLAPRATSAEPQAVAPPPIDSAGRILPGGDRGPRTPRRP